MFGLASPVSASSAEGSTTEYSILCLAGVVALAIGVASVGSALAQDATGPLVFGGIFGEGDNLHAARIVAEDGGSGPPPEIGDNHVVLVANHDQAQWDIGTTTSDPGDGVFARVGFDSKLSPEPLGPGPVPVFVNMDQNGLPSEGLPSSPVLAVTQGYIRVHLLQANSNDGLGGGRDPNGADMVLLEVYPVPEPSTFVLAALGLIGLFGLGWQRRRTSQVRIGGAPIGKHQRGGRHVTPPPFVLHRKRFVTMVISVHPE